MRVLSGRERETWNSKATAPDLREYIYEYVYRERERKRERGIVRMSGKGSVNNGGGGGGVVMIPAGSRKMVESLKEIVSNYSDSEIYAVLKECNMDPNEAVNRLLSQGPSFTKKP